MGPYYLLLDDTRTHRVLFPLIEMKNIFAKLLETIAPLLRVIPLRIWPSSLIIDLDVLQNGKIASRHSTLSSRLVP